MEGWYFAVDLKIPLRGLDLEMLGLSEMFPVTPRDHARSEKVEPSAKDTGS